jgi:hypothetical protein
MARCGGRRVSKRCEVAVWYVAGHRGEGGGISREGAA